MMKTTYPEYPGLVPSSRHPRRFESDVDFFTLLLVIPSRYPMAPPNLAADAPVLNVLDPLRVNLFPMRGKETNQMITDNSECFLRLRISQKPLLAQSWLDRNFTPLAETDIVLVWLGL